MKKGLFITGTDTGVGKTVIAAAVIRALHAYGINACGMKPIETGCHRDGDMLYPSDGMFLKTVAHMDETVNYVTPYCFEAPVAPYVASEMEQKEIDINVIVDGMNILLQRYPAVVVEGVGGLLAPIRKDYFVLDLIKEMGLPAVVVARPSLGTINHTLLTVGYALKEGIRVSGIIMNFSRPPDSTPAENTNQLMIKQLSPVPFIGTFPYLDGIGDDTLERAALRHLNTELLRAQFD